MTLVFLWTIPAARHASKSLYEVKLREIDKYNQMQNISKYPLIKCTVKNNYSCSHCQNIPTYRPEQCAADISTVTHIPGSTKKCAVDIISTDD